jgi:LPS-assembly lipoprotein
MVAGCGFQPLYAPGSIGDAIYNDVRIDAPDTVQGFVLAQRLKERLGHDADLGARLTLSVQMTSQQTAATITSGGDTTRFDVTGTAKWVLSDDIQGEQLTGGGTVNNFTSYSTTGSTVATQTARADAERRLAVMLADQITTQLFLQLEDQ